MFLIEEVLFYDRFKRQIRIKKFIKKINEVY